MNNKQVSFLLFCFLLIGCNYWYPYPGNYIADLEDVQTIKIYFGDSLRHTISKDEHIDYLLSTFKIEEKVFIDNKVNPNDFEKNGAIQFWNDENKLFEVKMDVERGYACEINGQKYYRRFNYSTGMYLFHEI